VTLTFGFHVVFLSKKGHFLTMFTARHDIYLAIKVKKMLLLPQFPVAPSTGQELRSSRPENGQLTKSEHA
jgi:hypothetical protein